MLGFHVQADAGGSPSLIARGFATGQTAGATEQFEMKVPNDKVMCFFHSFMDPNCKLYKILKMKSFHFRLV